MGSALLLDNLEKYFPPTYTGWRTLAQPFAKATVRALGGVSLETAAGEPVAIIGANGAGKSTLLRILGTLLIPTRGRALVAGHDVEREPARVRRKIGYHTGGDAGFYARLSARENLEFFASLNNMTGIRAKEAIREAAELMGLGSAMSRQVRTLSTGTVQRLGLARAMVHGPELLLLDEPTRSLDPLTAAEFRKFLKKELIGKRGTTIVFASHTLEEVAELADRVVLLDAGRIVASDTVPGLLRATGRQTLEEAMAKLTPRAEAAGAEAE